MLRKVLLRGEMLRFCTVVVYEEEITGRSQ